MQGAARAKTVRKSGARHDRRRQWLSACETTR